MKRVRSTTVVLVFLLGANIPPAIAQTDGSAIVGVVTAFFAEANAHNIGCGGLGEPSPIDKGAAAAQDLSVSAYVTRLLYRAVLAGRRLKRRAMALSEPRRWPAFRAEQATPFPEDPADLIREARIERDNQP